MSVCHWAIDIWPWTVFSVYERLMSVRLPSLRCHRFYWQHAELVGPPSMGICVRGNWCQHIHTSRTETSKNEKTKWNSQADFQRNCHRRASNGVKCTHLWPNPFHKRCNHFLFFSCFNGIRTPVPLSQTITFRPLLSIFEFKILTLPNSTHKLSTMCNFSIVFSSSDSPSGCRYCLKSVTNVKNAAGVIA